ILLVDDEVKIVELTADLLRRHGYHVTTAGSGDEAVVQTEEQSFNVIITDMQMPGLSWEPLLRKFLVLHASTPVILLTAYGTIERGLELIRKGAYDLVSKPFNEKDFLLRVARAIEKEDMTSELRALRSRLPSGEPD